MVKSAVLLLHAGSVSARRFRQRRWTLAWPHHMTCSIAAQGLGQVCAWRPRQPSETRARAGLPTSPFFVHRAFFFTGMFRGDIGRSEAASLAAANNFRVRGGLAASRGIGAPGSRRLIASWQRDREKERGWEWARKREGAGAKPEEKGVRAGSK